MGSSTALLSDSRQTPGRGKDLEYRSVNQDLVNQRLVMSWSPVMEDSCCGKA